MTLYDTIATFACARKLTYASLFTAWNEKQKQKNKEEKLKTKHSQKKRPGQESVQSVLKEGKSLWWKEFQKRVLSRKWKCEAIMDEVSRESTGEVEVGAGIRDIEICTRLTNRNGELIPQTWWSISKGTYGARMMWVNEWVTRDEERVLRGGWTKIRLCRYEGWVVVRTLCVSDRSMHTMCSVILSQWREPRMGMVWQDLGSLTTARERVLDLLGAVYLRLRKVGRL